MGNKPARPSIGSGHVPHTSHSVVKPFRKSERAQLRRIFDDLAQRSVSGKNIDKETFLKFFSNVPGMLGERLYAVFSGGKGGEIGYDQFVAGIGAYCRGTSEQKIEFVFKMFNLRGDGKVSLNELETMLNSFVFAAESIVHSREAERSVIKRPQANGADETDRPRRSQSSAAISVAISGITVAHNATQNTAHIAVRTAAVSCARSR